MTTIWVCAYGGGFEQEITCNNPEFAAYLAECIERLFGDKLYCVVE